MWDEKSTGRDVQELAGPVLDRCAVLLPGVSELQLLGGADSVTESIHVLFARNTLQTIVLKRGRPTLFGRAPRTG